MSISVTVEIVSAEGWQVSSYEREVDIKQPQQVTPSVHGWLLNRNRHQPLPCPPEVCKCTCWLFSATTITFWYFLPEAVGFPLFEESLCNPSPFSGTLYLPVSFSGQSCSQLCCQAASPCPSPCVSVEPCVGHCTLPSFWGCVLSLIPYSFLLPCAGKPGCELGGWMFLRFECSMAPSLAG